MAQNYWSSHAGTAKIVTDKSVSRKSFPANYKLFDLNLAPLKKDLYAVVGNASKHTIIISIPMLRGKWKNLKWLKLPTSTKNCRHNFLR
jgi:hypothetical protein